MSPLSKRHPTAFTLLELMLVIVVAAVLVTMATIALRRTLASQKLRAVAGRLAGDLALAAQFAATQNRTVSVIFLEGKPLKPDATLFTGWQLQAVHPQTGVLTPLEEPCRLEPGLMLMDHADYSTVLRRARPPGEPARIEFKAEGGTTLPFDAGQRWCITLALDTDGKRDPGALPPDSRTLVINAHTGAVTVY